MISPKLRVVRVVRGVKNPCCPWRQKALRAAVRDADGRRRGNGGRRPRVGTTDYTENTDRSVISPKLCVVRVVRGVKNPCCPWRQKALRAAVRDADGRRRGNGGRRPRAHGTGGHAQRAAGSGHRDRRELERSEVNRGSNHGQHGEHGSFGDVPETPCCPCCPCREKSALVRGARRHDALLFETQSSSHRQSRSTCR